MRTKAAFLVGAAVGYVFGTAAGREKFEEIRTQARKVWDDPRVQSTVSDIEDKAGDVVRARGPEIKDKLTEAVKSAADAASSKAKDLKDSASGSSTSGTTSGTTRSSSGGSTAAKRTSATKSTASSSKSTGSTTS